MRLRLVGTGKATLRAPVAPGNPRPTVVRQGSVSALVVPVADDERVSVKALRRHEELADDAAAAQTFVPARFGMDFATADEVRQLLLGPHERSLCAAAARVECRVELRVCMKHDGQRLLEEIVNADSEIRRLRRHIRSDRPRGSYHDRIALGQAVAHALERAQRHDLSAVEQRLAPAVVEQRLVDLVAGQTARVALLVDRGAVVAVDEELGRISDDLAGRASLSVVGPMAAWDFADAPTPQSAGGSLLGASLPGPRRRSRERAGAY